MVPRSRERLDERDAAAAVRLPSRVARKANASAQAEAGHISLRELAEIPRRLSVRRGHGSACGRDRRRRAADRGVVRSGCSATAGSLNTSSASSRSRAADLPPTSTGASTRADRAGRSASTRVKCARSGSARSSARRSHPRTVVAGSSNSAAIASCVAPAALATSAAPITAVASRRRAKHTSATPRASSHTRDSATVAPPATSARTPRRHAPGASRSTPDRRHPETRPDPDPPATDHRRSGNTQPPPHPTRTRPAPAHDSPASLSGTFVPMFHTARIAWTCTGEVERDGAARAARLIAGRPALVYFPRING